MDILNVSQIVQVLGADAPDARWENVEINSVSIDSRTVGEGCLFIAIKGDNMDGHDFVKTALDSGASAAVCSRDMQITDKPIIMVEDTRAALMALAAYNRLRYDIPVVGLTGSVGKTTSKDMIAAVLREKYNTLATEGNLNNEIGLPRMCLRLDSSVEAAVLEMGMSDFGEISRLTRTARPTVGLITNIGVSHIEMLGSRDGILKAKLEILEGMEPDAPLIINGDDDKLAPAADSMDRKVIRYGINGEKLDCRAENISQGEDSLSFTLTYKGESHDIKLPVVGLHNVYNACAAFVCGDMVGVSAQQAIKGLADYVPDARRQKIVRKKGMTFIEDCYNASPDSIKASLSVLCSLECTGKRIAVLGDMLELGDYAERAHRDCGAMAAQLGVDILLAYGENAVYYAQGAGDTVKTTHYTDKTELAQQLYDMLGEGDAVMFKASRGMKLEDVIAALYEKLGN